MKVGLGLGIALFVLAVPAHATGPRPPPFIAEGACELFEGSAQEQEMAGLWTLRFRLCPKGEHGITGEAQYDHPEWGYSIRSLEGDAQGTRLALRELAFVAYQPGPGWDFCLMDSYDFERPTPDVLEGRGVSKACGDYNTRYKLRRVRAANGTSGPSTPPSSTSSAGPPTEPAPPPAPPGPGSASASDRPAGSDAPTPAPELDPAPLEPEDRARVRASGCGCELTALGRAGASSAAGGSFALVVAFGLGLRVRRAAARRRVARTSAPAPGGSAQRSSR